MRPEIADVVGGQNVEHLVERKILCSADRGFLPLERTKFINNLQDLPGLQNPVRSVSGTAHRYGQLGSPNPYTCGFYDVSCLS